MLFAIQIVIVTAIPSICYGILTTCKLNRHLADVNKQTEDMFFRLLKQMAEREGVTEQLKAGPNGVGSSDE